MKLAIRQTNISHVFYQAEHAELLIKRATVDELEQAGLSAPPMPCVPPGLDKVQH